MISTARLRQVLPIVVSAAIVAFAGHALLHALRQIAFRDVIAAFGEIPAHSIASAALLVMALYGALATYEVIIVRKVKAAVSDGVAVVDEDEITLRAEEDAEIVLVETDRLN